MVILGVSFMMCLHMFIILFVLSNYVTSFAVRANGLNILVIQDWRLKICIRYIQLIFFFQFIFCHIYRVLTFHEPSLRWYWNYSWTIQLVQIYLTLSLESKWFTGSYQIKVLLVEPFVFSHKIYIFCISKTFLDSSVNDIYDE